MAQAVPAAMTRLRTTLGLLLAALAAATLGATPAAAQTNGTANAVAGLFGALIQGAQQSAARKSWQAVTPEARSCVDTAISGKGLTVDQLVQAGIKPDDARVARITNFCQAVMARQLREDFPCQANDDSGQAVQTRCAEVFAERTGGRLRPVDRDTFIRLAASGGTVEVATTEMPAARDARLAAAREARAQAQQQAEASAREQQRLADLKAAEARRRAREQAQKELATFRPY